MEMMYCKRPVISVGESHTYWEFFRHGTGIEMPLTNRTNLCGDGPSQKLAFKHNAGPPAIEMAYLRVVLYCGRS